MKTNRGMKMNNPSEQRAYVRRLKKLRAQVRRWGGDYRKDSRRQIDGPFLIGDPRERRWGDYRHPRGRDRELHPAPGRLQEINEAYDELRRERHALDGDLCPAPGRRNREIDDGGLD